MMMAEERGIGPARSPLPHGPGRDDLFRRLAWTYGVDRAASIVAGLDPDTELDIARWRGLGRGDWAP